VIRSASRFEQFGIYLRLKCLEWGEQRALSVEA